MIAREVHAKTILSKSKVFDCTFNPYIGCERGCTYCYARFNMRYTGHKEKRGEFVHAKINAPYLSARARYTIPFETSTSMGPFLCYAALVAAFGAVISFVRHRKNRESPAA